MSSILLFRKDLTFKGSDALSSDLHQVSCFDVCSFKDVKIYGADVSFF